MFGVLCCDGFRPVVGDSDFGVETCILDLSESGFIPDLADIVSHDARMEEEKEEGRREKGRTKKQRADGNAT